MKKLLFLALIGMNFLSCSKNDKTLSPSVCEKETLISSEQYLNSASALFTINNISIDGNCLKINFSSSGCNGDSWVLKLVDSGAAFRSNPPQRNLRLSLINEELCEAYITKETSFDISNLQVDGDKVYLNISNSNQGILYEY